jgi:hypothetical protein
MYGRWLLIGPLTALGIAVIVNIWQLSGLPISVSESYTPEIFSAEKVSNIVFYLPGKDTANTLQNSQEMMEYIIFLIMLYLPIVLAFTLTRRKVLHESLVAVTKSLIKNSQTSQQQLIQQALGAQEKEEERKERHVGIIDTFRNLVNDRIGIFAETAMPLHKMKVSPETPNTMMPTASNFLSENLQKTPIPKMLELLGRQNDSKASHTRTIEKLARLETITDTKEKEKVQAVMKEIEARAGEKDNEALAILHEVETVKEVDARNSNEKPTSIHMEGANPEAASSININVNDSKPEADRKVRDASLDSKSEEKGKDKKKKDEKESKEKKNDEGKNEEIDKSPNPDSHAN